MTQTEEYFPRGKVAPSVAKANKLSSDADDEVQVKKLKRKSKDKLDNLFVDFEKPKSEWKTKKKGKKSKHALTPEEEKALRGKRRSDEKRFAVVPLSYDQVAEGMLSLGIVTKITDHELFVTLPGRVIGTVSITEISTPYVRFIEKHAKNLGKGDENVVFYTLKEMFWIGQNVVVKVKAVVRGETRVKITLSMNPVDIHANYSTTVLKEDLVLVAAVASEEDHGYVMDIGINGARCFLSREDAKKFIPKGNFNRPLGIGQLLYCKINNITVHRLIADVKLTAFMKAVKTQKMDDFIGLNYSTLLPGMLVDVIVMETHKTGLMAHCLDLNGLVYQDHMENEWISPESIEIGSTVPARILYILPNLTTPYLTLQMETVPLSNYGDRSNRDKLGSKEQVRIVRTEQRGLIVKIEDGGYKGLIPLYHLGNEALVTIEDISKRFKDNSVHEARVLKYCPLERMYICSFKKDLLESDIVHPEKAIAGKTVKCQILQWNKGGALVTFGAGMRGFIPNSLFRQETLSEATKEKLIGSTHKARIFTRQSEKERVLLTARKEFVKSKGAVISSIDQAEKGMIGHAMIQAFNKVGIYVKTIGDCEGFIPKSKLSNKYIENLRDVFHFGQIVEYKVISINQEKNHLVLSLKLDEDTDETQKQHQETDVGKVKKGKRKIEISPADVEDEPGPKRKKKTRRSKRKKNVRKIENTRPSSDQTANDSNDEEDRNNDDNEVCENSEIENQTGTQESLEVPENQSFWDTSLNTSTKDSDKSDSSDNDDNSTNAVKKPKMKKATLKVSVPLNMVSGSHNECVSKATPSLETIEKYEKGIIINPNDPLFWTGLMSHYSSIGIIDKARAVAKQALEMINYRDEKAKLKVWGALLKLEVKYGTEDSLKPTLADALQRNDQFECLKLMALVYDNADRFKDAEKTYRQVVKQFRLEPEAWIRFGTFYYQRKKYDSGRELLNEALSAIPFNKHVQLITKFALLEIHHGEKNRGESMFDQILAQSKHQQCSNLWMMYINALVKSSDYESARAVFMRAFDIKWHAKKAKPLLKRYLEFEKEHGTEDNVKEFQNVAVKVLSISLNG